MAEGIVLRAWKNAIIWRLLAIVPTSTPFGASSQFGA
jgi:hypothetical protein